MSEPLDVVGWIDQRIADMLRVPRMWGSYEAVELQVLTLVELRFTILNPKTMQEKPRFVLDAYREFLRGDADLGDSAKEMLSGSAWWSLYDLTKQNRSVFATTLARFVKLTSLITMKE